MSNGTIYILTNDDMPGIIKIGITSTSVNQRMRELDTTGIPSPFRCHFAIEVDGYDTKEKLIHDGFSDHRIRKNREFFRLSPERAVSILKAIGGKEINQTNEMIGEDGIVHEEANSPERQIRSRFNFEEIGILPGAELTFTRDENIICKVLDARRVEYNGKFWYLSPLAQMLLKNMGYNWDALQGSLFFKYEGEILQDRRDRLENEAAECELAE